MFAFCLMFGGLVAVNAQDTTSTSQPKQEYPTSTQQDDQDQDREKISSRDLPDAVKRSLENQDYRGWLVNAAYKTKGVEDKSTQDMSTQNQTDSTSTEQNSSTTSTNQNDTTSVSGKDGAYGQEVYVVELKNGAQTKTVRFDKDGKKLDDPGMKNDQD